jgi:taurine dioxygenase
VTSGLVIRPLAGALGAEVAGVDLSGPLSDAVFGEIHAAFLEHHVLCFREQRLDAARQLAFARRFGEPEVHPIVEGTAEHPDVIRVHKPAGESASFGVGWHSDNTFLAAPSLCTVLYGETIPPQGGDTLFACQERAYQALSEPLQRALADARAIHTAREAYDPALVGEAKYRGEAPLRYRYSDAIHAKVSHPVVRTHPESGRRALFVNPMFATRLEGFHRGESDALLAMLFAHGATPDFTCRVRWQPGTLTVWDNRSVWHYAMDDYQAYERVMYRVTIAGDVPR